jgi:hypothetical protein
MSAWVPKGDEIISVVRASVSAGVDGGHPIRFRSGWVPLMTGCFGTMAVALLLLAIALITASQGGRRPILLILGMFPVFWTLN